MFKVTFKRILKAILPYMVLWVWRKYKHKLALKKSGRSGGASAGAILLSIVSPTVPDIDVPDNCVLLIEFSICHGENLVCLAKCVLDLGYSADVIMAARGGSKEKLSSSYNRNDEGIFSVFQDAELRGFYWDAELVELFFRSDKVKKYRHIIVATTNDAVFEGVDAFELKPICVVHGNEPKITNEYGKTNKLISFLKMDLFDRKQPTVVGVHYFGDHPLHKKNTITEFVAFGNPKADDIRRNLNLVKNVCAYLKAKKINNYKIKIIGDYDVESEHKENIQSLGFLPFSEMYKTIEQADFILALIDPASVEYTNRCAGVYPLSYRFLTPILIHQKFAEPGSFTYKNSIIYEDDFFPAVERAIFMKTQEYGTMVEQLETDRKLIYKQSLNNLKSVLDAEVKIL